MVMGVWSLSNGAGLGRGAEDGAYVGRAHSGRDWLAVRRTDWLLMARWPTVTVVLVEQADCPGGWASLAFASSRSFQGSIRRSWFSWAQGRR
jgi:hypothetical protein